MYLVARNVVQYSWERTDASPLRTQVRGHSHEALDQPVDGWNAILVPLIVSKFDPIANREWEAKINSDEFSRDRIPTLSEVITFLTNKHDALEAISARKTTVDSIAGPSTKTKEPRSIPKKTFLAADQSCSYCKGSHLVDNCSSFLKLSAEARLEKVRKLNLCINCLNAGHLVARCPLGSCRKCNARHHTLLHFERRQPAPTVQSDQNASQQQQPASAHSDQTSTLSSQTLASSAQVLLATASIKVLDAGGNVHIGRILLDSGSQSNFITTEFCNKIGIEQIKTEVAILGLNQTTTNTNYKCNVSLQSRINNFQIALSCLIVPQICDRLPNNRINIETLGIPKHIKLADPQFDKPGKIDMLLGADHFWNMLCIGQIKLKNDQLILQKTRFGYVISGPIDQRHSAKTHCNLIKNIDIQDQLTRFWEVEEFVCDKRLLSEEESACESHFLKTVQRNADGRFIVSIPFKDNLDKLGDSLGIAKRRFYNLERKLQRNIPYRQNYVQFMDEYITANHMSALEPDIISNSKYNYYMPHHGVIKEDSLTTKLRVVFDGSCPTTSGFSINDLQRVGPTIQDDLVSILIRFRQYPVVVSADIAKMYRQVLIDPNQRSLQRIVWRSDPTQPLRSYELNTVTYGTAAASFLAIRCLYELAIQNENQFPVASRVMQRDFYVDDMLTGANSVEEAATICNQVSGILKQGCFELRKWASNCPQVFDSSHDAIHEDDVLDFGLNENAKTLGLIWSCRLDHLAYNIGPNCTQGVVTKRSILSAASQIFDPLGLISAYTISAKIMLQKLWQEKIGWDESVSVELHSNWIRLREELLDLNDLRIPRHTVFINPIRIELHCFSDASELAFGACSYIRSLDTRGNYSVNLLCAKTRVAPIKPLTVPRLELCAALIAARLSKKIAESLDLQLEIYLWTDSTIVLSWINTPANMLKTFVANRINEIQCKTDSASWRHVKSLDNPADLLSRSISPMKLKSSDLWWHGPHWLQNTEEDWPISYICSDQPIQELKTNSKTFLIVHDISIFARYSSLITLQRVTAYCFRFCHNAKVDRLSRRIDPLSVDELFHALSKLIQLSQLEHFAKEISSLNKECSLQTNSKLISLNPFIDRKGLLRVGGRLENSAYDFEKRHPIILPAGHALSKLISRYEHIRLLHCGPQALLYSLRDRYWPIAGRNLARKIVHECIACFRNKPKHSNFVMGNLPRERVTAAPVFFNTGVDYAGPLMIRDRRTRGYKTVKGYICLFVCFATKAIHLELVGDLTSECFLAALRRFISRRGRPSNVYSDNGTNFVGAHNELREHGDFLMINGNKLTRTTAADGFNWHFIPAHSPHFGGLWEAGVKSVKHHLKRVIGNALLTYEEMHTVLTQIEAVLNSRPISPLSTDPNDLNPLTPAHFLVGRPLTALPDTDLRHLPENRLSRFQLLQNLHQHFWARWSKEYISGLQQRTKWKREQPGIALGTLVLIKDDNLPPLSWRLGRIVELHPGLDAVVRVVSVQTTKGVLKRAISKICPFPIEI